MTERDLRQALEGSVETMRLSGDAKASILESIKEERPVKKKLSTGLVLAMVLALLATAALAASWGILDRIGRSAGWSSYLPSAQEIIQRPLAEVENDYVTYAVREAIYDGRAAYIMVEVTPKDKTAFLLSESTWPEDPVGYFIVGETGAEKTCAEYAVAHGYTSFLTVGVDPGEECAVSSSWEEGVLTLLVEYEAQGDALPVELSLWAWADAIETQKDHLVFTLTASDPLWERTAEAGIDLPDYGVRIDALTLTGTALSTYFQVDYTVTDIDAHPGALGFHLMDAQGQYFPRGAISVGGSKGLAQASGEKMTWRGGAVAMETAPRSVMLEMSPWTEESLPVWTHVFELK